MNVARRLTPPRAPIAVRCVPPSESRFLNMQGVSVSSSFTMSARGIARLGAGQDGASIGARHQAEGIPDFASRILYKPAGT